MRTFLGYFPRSYTSVSAAWRSYAKKCASVPAYPTANPLAGRGGIQQLNTAERQPQLNTPTIQVDCMIFTPDLLRSLRRVKVQHLSEVFGRVQPVKGSAPTALGRTGDGRIATATYHAAAGWAELRDGRWSHPALPNPVGSDVRHASIWASGAPLLKWVQA